MPPPLIGTALLTALWGLVFLALSNLGLPCLWGNVLPFLAGNALWCLGESMGCHPRRIRTGRARGIPNLMAGAILLTLGVCSLSAARATATVVPLAVLGGILTLSGILLRQGALTALGPYFLDEIALAPGHRIVTTGLFAHLRHPSEAGTLLILSGMAIASRSLPGALLTAGLVLPLALLRIRREDQLLAGTGDGSTRAYLASTPRLIPRLPGSSRQRAS